MSFLTVRGFAKLTSDVLAGMPACELHSTSNVPARDSVLDLLVVALTLSVQPGFAQLMPGCAVHSGDAPSAIVFLLSADSSKISFSPNNRSAIMPLSWHALIKRFESTIGLD